MGNWLNMNYSDSWVSISLLMMNSMVISVYGRLDQPYSSTTSSIWNPNIISSREEGNIGPFFLCVLNTLKITGWQTFCIWTHSNSWHKGTGKKQNIFLGIFQTFHYWRTCHLIVMEINKYADKYLDYSPPRILKISGLSTYKSRWNLYSFISAHILTAQLSLETRNNIAITAKSHFLIPVYGSLIHQLPHNKQAKTIWVVFLHFVTTK